MAAFNEKHVCEILGVDALNISNNYQLITMTEIVD